MQNFKSRGFEEILHPYIFVLKEGQGFRQDFLDYSLLLLQVGKPEHLASPKRAIKSSSQINQLLKK